MTTDNKMWEVQQYTLCDGWVNTWTTYEVDGSKYPTQFGSYDEAWVELQDVLNTAFESGMDYSFDDYRIVKVE